MSRRRAKAHRLGERRPDSLQSGSQPPREPSASTAPGRLWWAVGGLALVASAWLLLFHLGSYSFWCDEADNVIFARGIARTGDTLGLLDHNLYGYRRGATLKDLHCRFQPPLPYYITAPFVGKEGVVSNFWPRFPFAVFGLLSVALMLWWLGRSPVPDVYRYVLVIGLLGNVSFFLFCRQCRYYSLAILLSLVISYVYLNWNGRLWMLAIALVASILMIETHYLAHVTLYAAIGCDYLLFGRRTGPFTLGQLTLLLVPQIVVGLVTVWIYNPLGSAVIPPTSEGRNPIIDHLTLVWYFFRDQNISEHGVGLLILAAPVLYYWNRNIWLLRGGIACAVYTVATALVQPYPVTASIQASVRYLVAQIPLGIAVSSLVIVTLSKYRWRFAVPLAIIAYGSNVLNLPFSPDQWRSTPVQFIQEIWEPRPTPTEVAARWINENVTPGQTVWVRPDYLQPALMYYAPHALYAWQLNPPPQKQFADLPPIHFFGQGLPDYFLIFGPERALAENVVAELRNRKIVYTLSHVLDIYWDDRTRPEILWRDFSPRADYSQQREAVYIYRHRPELDGK